MGIGPITPGNWITVTADTITALPGSYTFTPSPTMAILSANLQSLTLQMATNDKYLDDYKVDTRGDTMTGDLNIPSHGLIAKTVEVTLSLDITGTPALCQAILAADTVQAGASAASAVELRGTTTAAVGGILVGAGRKRLRRSRPTVDIGGAGPGYATKTCGVVAGTGVDHAGDGFNLPGTTSLHTGVAPIVVLKSTGTGTTPSEGETLSFYCVPVGLSAEVGPPSVIFRFHDESAVILATVEAPLSGAPMTFFWLTFEFTGGAWTLAENSGLQFEDDGAGGVASYGVVAP